jgi:transposase
MSEETSVLPDGKRAYYRPTTADQRKRLFTVYEQTRSVRQAAAAAHVGLGTYYYWRPRFAEAGFAGLEQPRSHRPHTVARQVPEAGRQEVLAAKRAHPEWGRQRIADELRKAHGWQSVVSPSAVRRMLVEAGLWNAVALLPKGEPPAPAMPPRPTRR